MKILQVAVNKLKCNFAEMISNDYIVKNYGIKSCATHILKPFENIKLELIFLANIEYVCLTDDQLRKVKAGNYRNIFLKETDTKILEMELIDPVIII